MQLTWEKIQRDEEGLDCEIDRLVDLHSGEILGVVEPHRRQPKTFYAEFDENCVGMFISRNSAKAAIEKAAAQPRGEKRSQLIQDLIPVLEGLLLKVFQPPQPSSEVKPS